MNFNKNYHDMKYDDYSIVKNNEAYIGWLHENNHFLGDESLVGGAGLYWGESALWRTEESVCKKETEHLNYVHGKY